MLLENESVGGPRWWAHSKRFLLSLRCCTCSSASASLDFLVASLFPGRELIFHRLSGLYFLAHGRPICAFFLLGFCLWHSHLLQSLHLPLSLSFLAFNRIFNFFSLPSSGPSTLLDVLVLSHACSPLSWASWISFHFLMFILFRLC